MCEGCRGAEEGGVGQVNVAITVLGGASNKGNVGHVSDT